MPQRRKIKRVQEEIYVPLSEKDLDRAIEIPVKSVKREDIEKIEKKGTRKEEKYILIITEKPQAALKIAYALGKNVKKKTEQGVSYYELERDGKKIIVACAVGHLFTISQSKKGGGWPIFDVEWKPNFKVRKQDFSRKYYNLLVKLAKNADSFIVSTDYDVEGEVIGWNIMRFICKQKNAKRMKFSTLTASELQESYEKVMPNIDWGQAYAGETRHILDWLYGINLSRALMQAIKSAGNFRIMSIGRVQGPTLHLVVDKELSIKNFKPERYWQVFLLVSNKHKIEVKYEKDITKKEELEKFKKLEGKEAEAVTEKVQQEIPPPVPFDLTTLQVEAYKFYGISPARTLQIAQQLYLAGLISYPRTSSQKIPESINPKKIIQKLSSNFQETRYITRSKPIEGSKSDPAHPSIYPTGEFSEIDGENKKIYELIVKRFISCFSANAVVEDKKIIVKIENLRFIARGLKILEKGWIQVYPAKMQEKILPDMYGKVIIEKVKIEEKFTQPPKRYTPASLISELAKRNLGTKCLTKDTKIIIDNKLIAIEDLFLISKPYLNDKDKEIRIIKGEIISLNRENKPKITSPKFISRRKINENEKVIKIETDSSTIKITGEHLIYVYKDNKIKETPAENLQINDNLIGITKNYSEGDVIIEKSIFGDNFKISNNEIKHKFSSIKAKGILISKFPINWSTSLAWMLGYYYGDGSYSPPKYNGSHAISFTTTEKKALNILKENIKNIFGNYPYAYDLKRKYKVNCNATMSYALIKKFPEMDGKNPIKIPKEFIGDFLRGFFDADGNVHLRPLKRTKIKETECNSFNTPRIKITLANEKLIGWIKELLEIIYIKTKINKGYANCKGKNFDCWTILIGGRDKVEDFAYKVGFDSYKEEILYKGLKCESWKYKILRNSAKISLLLKENNLKLEEIIAKTKLSKYQIIMALRRLFKLKMIDKKRIGPNHWLYSLKNNDRKYITHCMKLIYEKISENVYKIPIKRLSVEDYEDYVYDISVEKDSPNFITEGNLLVHNSTRAAIIETLYERGYIKDTSIQATPFGITLISALKKHSPIIIDEKLTRYFEKEMDLIHKSKNYQEKEKKVLEEAKKVLIKIADEFKKKEKYIGNELVKANNEQIKEEKEENKIMLCPICKKGHLTIKYNRKSRRYFVACDAYPECKTTFSLPPNALIKKSDKVCELCGWTKLLAIRRGKRPWEFCFNPNCESRKKKEG